MATTTKQDPREARDRESLRWARASYASKRVVAELEPVDRRVRAASLRRDNVIVLVDWLRRDVQRAIADANRPELDTRRGAEGGHEDVRRDAS